MPIGRYKSANEIVGQFLPKIYTNRITIEDLGVTAQARDGRTKITVDYHIKDLLDQNGAGVITQTRENTEGSDIQDKILQSLKVATVLLSNKEDAASFARDVYNLSNLGFTEDAPFSIALGFLSFAYAVRGQNNLLSVVDGRPQEVGFEFRNTIYETLDRDNNVINVIPYSKSYELNNSEWDNCDNLSLVCFTFFDFGELDLSSDGLSAKNANKLGYLIGDLSLDAILVGGNIESTARVYKDRETNTPYYGPVHYHSEESPGPGGYVGYMAGYGGADMGPTLRAIQVPVTKIQDFRKLQRTRLVNYQPPQLEYFNSKTPGLSFLEKRNKNHFRTENVIVDYDYAAQETNIEFSVNFRDIYKNNSRYYDLLNGIPIYNLLPLNYLMRISNIRVLRRRMTRHAPGHTRLSTRDRVKFDKDNQLDHVVVSSTQSRTNSEVIEKQDEFGAITQTGLSLDERSFYAKDYEISKYHGSNASYQYGVEITILDNTKQFLLNFVERGRTAVNALKRYSQKSKIPVFDTYYINKSPDSLPVGLGADEYPEFGDTVTQGNYNTRTKSFTDKFKREAREEFGVAYAGFEYYVDLFLLLVQLSFGKSGISFTKSAVNSVQRDDRLESPLTALQSLQDDGRFRFPDGQGGGIAEKRSLVNMISPSNARPETIDAFIRSFEDLVLELEDFLDADYLSRVDNEGGGYTSKGNRSITVQRWFNDTVYGVDEDNFITLRPYKLYFNYDLGGITLNSPRSIDYGALVERLRVEIENFNISPDAPLVISPASVVIGSTEIYFGEVPSLPPPPGTKRIPVAIEDRHLQHALGIFIEELLRLQESDDLNELATYINSFNQLGASNMYAGLLGLIDHMSQNTVVYGDDVLPLTATPPEINFRLNSNQCGLVDNTPVEVVRNDRSIFFPEQEGFAGLGYSQIGSLLGGIDASAAAAIADIAPQLTSDGFPSGGIWDRSLRVLYGGDNPLTFNGITSVPPSMRVDLGSLDVFTGGGLSNALNQSAGNALGMGGPASMPRSIKTESEVPASHGYVRLTSPGDTGPDFGGIGAGIGGTGTTALPGGIGGTGASAFPGGIGGTGVTGIPGATTGAGAISGISGIGGLGGTGGTGASGGTGGMGGYGGIGGLF